MKVFHKWIILAALLFLALASYSYGFSNGVFAFVALGIIFELAFWLKIFGKTQRSSKTIN
ncbi:hypothetical protein [Colwellia sp. PAMC 21821]|uniref:hypothetical protein n=1 Tax=Colwellia sp. PAMC 21821 TaxID=1816219 RepID=UPI0009BDEB65|nr:hypothetical protein [Colwellia sp. PAMC 21821]ARD46393.1 hypothetical protein A3Q33_20175 [Colwellia sp. PAMC 21821]